MELSDDDLNALGGLSKTTASGLSYNPYQKIDPKFLELNKFDEEDDEDWLYTTVSTCYKSWLKLHESYLAEIIILWFLIQ